MNINSLPTEIILAILKPLCREEFYINNILQRPMNILSVCQKWRQLALPVSFDTIFIIFCGNLQTNMDAMSDDMKHYPRTVEIRVNFMYKDPVGCLEKALEELQANKRFLDNVVNLVLSFDIPYESVDPDLKKPVKDRLARMAKDISILFPNISSLFNYLYSNNRSLHFALTALLKLYAPQLTQVNLEPSLLGPDPRLTNSLSDVRLLWREDSSIIQKMNVDNLTRLELSNVDEPFDWSIFFHEDANGSNVLHFPALKSFFIHIAPRHMTNDEGNTTLVGSRNRFTYTLDAPNLEFLVMKSICPLTCSLIASISTPKSLKKLSISVNYELRIVFYRFSLLDTVKNVFEQHYKNSIANPKVDAYQLANDLQAIDGFTCSAVEAFVEEKITTSDVERICWPQVTRLSIMHLMDLADIMELIRSKLPNLVKLEAYYIDLKRKKKAPYVIPELQDGAISPIECKLRSLVYGYDDCFSKVPKKVLEVFEESIAKVVPSLKDVSFGRPKYDTMT